MGNMLMVGSPSGGSVASWSRRRCALRFGGEAAGLKSAARLAFVGVFDQPHDARLAITNGRLYVGAPRI